VLAFYTQETVFMAATMEEVVGCSVEDIGLEIPATTTLTAPPLPIQPAFICKRFNSGQK